MGQAERIIRKMAVKGADVTEEEAERIYERELRKDIAEVHPHAVSLVPDVLWGAQTPRMGRNNRRNSAISDTG